MACEPNDGHVNRETQVFLAGRPIADLAEMSLRPVLDSIPPEHRARDAHFLFEHYLKPYLYALNNGRHYFRLGVKEICIGGIVYRATGLTLKLSDEERERHVAMVEGGLVSQLTQLTPLWSSPISAEEMEQIRIDDDLEFARRLQEEEDRRERESAMAALAAAGGGGGGGGHGGGGAGAGGRPARYIVQFGSQRVEIPPESDAARVLEQLHQQRMRRGDMDPATRERWNSLDSFIERTAVLVFMQEMQGRLEQARDRARALPERDIGRLPTWKYTRSTGARARDGGGGGDAGSDEDEEDDDLGGDVETTCRS